MKNMLTSFAAVSGLSSFFNRLCVFVFAIVCASAVNAASIVNPSPGIFGDDIGAKYFNPSAASIPFEVYDPLEAGFLTSFGFYFRGADLSNPSNVGIIFDATDLSLVGTQIAVIDFVNGFVVDVDGGNTLKDVFSGSGQIGFFFMFIDPATNNAVSIFSDPGLNPDGLDHVASFRGLSDPSFYLLGFEVAFPGQAPATVAFEAITALNSVPAPGTLALIGIGLAAGLGKKGPFSRAKHKAQKAQ